MDTPFTVEKTEELIALHRVFIEAKFSPNPNDRDIGASPIVCELYKRIFDRLKADGNDWDGWLKNQKNRFLQTVRSNLKGIASWEWQKWTEEKKKMYGAIQHSHSF